MSVVGSLLTYQDGVIGVCMWVLKSKGLRSNPWGLAAFKDLEKNSSLILLKETKCSVQQSHKYTLKDYHFSKE